MAGKKIPQGRRVVHRVRRGVKQQEEAQADTRPSPRRKRTSTDHRQAQEREQAAQRLLLAITRVQSLFIDEAQPAMVFGVLLQEVLTLTDSEYGFIGEVNRTPEGQPFLRTQAITDIAWNTATKALMAEQAPTLVFRNLKTLFGHVMTTGKPVIANDPAHDPRAGGLPPGHPPMHAFLGVPFYRGELLTGMVGMANRPGGYDEAVVAYLEPFLSTCAQLLEGYRNRRLRADAEAALHSSEERWQLAIQGSQDGIWDWNLRSNEVYFSHRWKEMLGYDEHEIPGRYQEWESRLHPEDRERVIAHLTAYLERRSARYHVEFRLRKKTGEYCWVEARGKATWDANGRPYRMAGSHTEITERKREDALRIAEKQTLELVARGTGLNEVLVFICRTIETHTSPMLCSVMLVTEDGMHLTAAAAPNLPDEYNRAVDGIPIGPTIGSCGSAAYFQTPAIVSDIATHPLWENYAPVAMAHGLKACWSQPIISSTGELLGTFAAYYREPRSPQSTDLNIVERASHIAAVAIEHAKVTEALRESEERFQAFMSHSPAVTFIKDAVGRHLYINPKFESLFGVSRDEIKDKTVFDFLPADIATKLHQNDQLVFASSQTLEIEETVPAPDGMVRHWLVIKFPLETGQQRLLGGVAVDITNRKQTEAALRESEHQHRSVVAAMAEGIVIQDRDGRIRSCNVGACRTLGLTEEQVLGRTSFDPRWQAIHEDGSPFPGDTHPAMTTLRTGLASENIIMGVHRPDESLAWISINTQPIIEIEGEPPTGVVVSFRDITAQKQRERELRLFRTLLDQVTDSIEVIDPASGRFLDGNRQSYESLGYTRNELSALTMPDIDPLVTKPVFQEHMRRLREAGGSVRIESVHRCKDGTTFPVEVVAQLIRDEKEYLVAIVRDIAMRKQAEEHLRRTRFAMDQAVDAVYWIDPQARILYTNEAASRMLGYTAEEFLRMAVHDLNPDFPPEAWPEWWMETREKKVVSLETVHLAKDGRRIPIDIHVSFLAYGGQEFHCAFVRNITQRKRAEAALRQVQDELEQRVIERTAELAQANQLLRDEITERKRTEKALQLTQFTVDRAAQGIFWVGPHAEILYVNEAAIDVLGYSREELLRMTVHDIDPNFPPEAWPSHWEELKRRGAFTFESSQHTKSGGVRYTEVTVNYLEYEGHEYNCAIVRDMTERKRAEEAIRDSELRYKLLTEATFDGIAIHDEGILLEVNAGLERMFGYESGELVGRSIVDLIAEESRAMVLANMRNGVNGPYEAVGRCKDGSTFPGEVVVRSCYYRGKEVRLVAGRDITVRKHLEAERARHTEELERQITERSAEIAKLESQRAQTERLAALGRLAAGVAHEINNPIAGIKNAFTLVKPAVDPAHPQYEFVGLIDREIARVSSIVQNMYQLYRREPGKVDAVDLRTMIGDIEALLAKQLQQRRLRLVVDTEPGFDRLDVPRSDFLQILLNLLNNAIDCSREGTTITLTIHEEAEIVRIALADQGTGIPPEVLPHIFDPFFTTKTEGHHKGMGLGLSISQSLVAAMGGRIDVDTQLGQGSTFSILLPRHSVVAGVPGQPHTIKEVMTHGD